jgi:hypothetical protein
VYGNRIMNVLNHFEKGVRSEKEGELDWGALYATYRGITMKPFVQLIYISNPPKILLVNFSCKIERVNIYILKENTHFFWVLLSTQNTM